MPTLNHSMNTTTKSPSTTNHPTPTKTDLSANSSAIAHRAAAEAQRAKAEQARINGAKSHGPTSPEGKARCSRNALKHGLTAEKHAVLDIERPEEFKAVYDAAIAEYRPKSLWALRLVEKLAHLEWRLERLAILDTAYLNYKINEAAGLNPLEAAAANSGSDEITALVRGWIAAVGSANALDLLRRYTATLQHQINSTVRNLEKLEKRQAAQLRDRDLPYQPPEFPTEAETPQDETETPQTHETLATKQTNPRRPATSQTPPTPIIKCG